MVAKKLEWQNAETASASQVRTYIDACKDWILATDSDTPVEEAEKLTQPIPLGVNRQLSENLGAIRQHIYQTNHFSCFLCTTDTAIDKGRIVNANAFARANCMLLCTACYAEVG